MKRTPIYGMMAEFDSAHATWWTRLIARMKPGI